MSNSNHIDWVLPHDPNWGLRDLLTTIITSNGDGHVEREDVHMQCGGPSRHEAALFAATRRSSRAWEYHHDEFAPVEELLVVPAGSTRRPRSPSSASTLGDGRSSWARSHSAACSSDSTTRRGTADVTA
eukprot:12620476-Heterocapsa_arctica.AAC.1